MATFVAIHRIVQTIGDGDHHRQPIGGHAAGAGGRVASFGDPREQFIDLRHRARAVDRGIARVVRADLPHQRRDGDEAPAELFTLRRLRYSPVPPRWHGMYARAGRRSTVLDQLPSASTSACTFFCRHCGSGATSQ